MSAPTRRVHDYPVAMLPGTVWVSRGKTDGRVYFLRITGTPTGPPKGRIAPVECLGCGNRWNAVLHLVINGWAYCLTCWVASGGARASRRAA